MIAPINLGSSCRSWRSRRKEQEYSCSSWHNNMGMGGGSVEDGCGIGTTRTEHMVIAMRESAERGCRRLDEKICRSGIE